MPEQPAIHRPEGWHRSRVVPPRFRRFAAANDNAPPPGYWLKRALALAVALTAVAAWALA